MEWMHLFINLNYHSDSEYLQRCIDCGDNILLLKVMDHHNATEAQKLEAMLKYVEYTPSK